MLLVVGRIGRAHGIHGEATIEIRTDIPDERFLIGAQLFTEPSRFGPLTIQSLRYHNGTLLLKFSQAQDRTAVEALRDVLLLADVDVEQESEYEDEYHVQQLIGCQVVMESGDVIGVLEDVLNLPGQDLLSIRGTRGEILIPFIAEFVPEVDVEAKKITVIPPEGLLTLQEGGGDE
jgi:16S rRNA processing protein RimM